MKWISVADRLPEKSGMVMVLTPGFEGLTRHLHITNYSAQHKAFNAYDGQENMDHAFTEVDYWAELPKGPKGVTIYDGR